MRVAPDDKRLLVSLGSGDVRLYDVSTRKELHNFQRAHQGGIWGTAIAPSGTLTDRYVISTLGGVSGPGATLSSPTNMLIPSYTKFTAGAQQPGTTTRLDTIDNRALAKELVAFANFQGGAVLLGVADDGSVRGIERPRLEEWVMTACRDKISRTGLCRV